MLTRHRSVLDQCQSFRNIQTDRRLVSLIQDAGCCKMNEKTRKNIRTEENNREAHSNRKKQCLARSIDHKSEISLISPENISKPHKISNLK
mmetsp:Transcript_60036/g.159588  ORF Transcript_60036/g.159588 Transcript_60036/m.159588 type:complete len:91 (-) Transcript_60036:91-363(-)